jgi:hypothetical protein
VPGLRKGVREAVRPKNQVSREEARVLHEASQSNISWRQWEKRVERLLLANHFHVEHQKPLKTKQENQRAHHKDKADFVAVGKVGTPSEGKAAVVECKTGRAVPTAGQLAYLDRWLVVPGVVACGIYYPVDYPRLKKQLGGNEPL